MAELPVESRARSDTIRAVMRIQTGIQLVVTSTPHLGPVDEPGDGGAAFQGRDLLRRRQPRSALEGRAPGSNVGTRIHDWIVLVACLAVPGVLVHSAEAAPAPLSPSGLQRIVDSAVSG